MFGANQGEKVPLLDRSQVALSIDVEQVVNSVQRMDSFIFLGLKERRLAFGEGLSIEQLFIRCNDSKP